VVGMDSAEVESLPVDLVVEMRSESVGGREQWL
jgi:hypothetical protein